MRFRANPSSIRGSIAPVVTPFTAEGEMDHDGLRRLVQWQLASGSHGISLGGSTGEPSAQTVAERIAAMRVVATDARAPIPASSPDHTRRLTMSFSIVRTLSHAVAGAASSPPQIVSTTSVFASSYSASPRGRVSKIQPDSTCSIAP